MLYWTDVLSGSPVSWGPALTLLAFLSHRPWEQCHIPGRLTHIVGCIYQVVILIGLVSAHLSASWIYWIILAGWHFFWIRLAYAAADNHRYLEGYWCIALAVALYAGPPGAADLLRRQALSLLGGCFALAAFWKLSNPRFRDGSFFIQTLLSDPRFLPLAYWLGGVRRVEHGAHTTAVARITAGQSIHEKVDVSPRVRVVAACLTWWTIVVELAIAVVCFSIQGETSVVRVVAIALFGATTYMLIPLPSFGVLLLIMTLTTTSDARLRAGLLVLAALVTAAPGGLKYAQRVVLRRMVLGDQQVGKSPLVTAHT